jgi:hypothetical protein
VRAAADARGAGGSGSRNAPRHSADQQEPRQHEVSRDDAEESRTITPTPTTIPTACEDAIAAEALRADR